MGRRAPDLIPPAPDPSLGLFETLLVARGRPIDLKAHLDRLTGSVAAVFQAELPSLACEAATASHEVELGRLRIQVGPEGEGLRHRLTVEEVDPAIVFPDHDHGARLRSVDGDGWTGAHKWSDRRWLERTEERCGEEVPLLVGAGGVVLEAGHANVFAVIDGVLLTPPADGRILPGTTRAATLDLARKIGIPTGERRLALSELRRGGEAFLTSSVRGIRPARSLDGEELASGPTTERLALELSKRWLG